jgi:hypothetical protein
MALARIFSDSPDYASALIHDLQQQGYQVEIVRPEEIPTGPADLEIQYELCDAHRVVERAQELASQAQADIVVESGVLGTASAEPAREDLPQAIIKADAPETHREIWEEPAVIVDPDPAQAWVEQDPAMESQIEKRQEFAPEQETILEQEEDRAPAALITPETGATETAAAPYPAIAMWSKSVTALMAFAGNSLDSAHGIWLAGLHKMREQRARAAIRMAEIRARREQQLLELACRRAETLQRSRQLEAARRAAAGYLSQLQLEAKAAAKDETQSGDSIASIPFHSRQREGQGWWPSRHMKHIAAGAAAAGTVFALTLGISTLRSKPEPAKPAPVPAPVVTVQSNRITAAQPQRPSPAVRLAKARPVPPRAVHAPVSSASQSDDGDVVDDVVIRHFAPAKSLQSRSRTSDGVKDGVKRISDSDN